MVAPKTYAVYAIGCQQNWYDAEKAAFACDQLGLVPTTTKEADLIIIFSCSVRQKAVDRLFGLVDQWRKTKKRLIILTACVLPKDKKTLGTKVDYIVPDQKILDWIYSHINPHESVKPTVSRELSLNFHRQLGHAFVPITIGCNNFCTFCAVPHTRGREISRPRTLIIGEVSRLVKEGNKSITLLGQNVNSYGLSDFKPRDLRKNISPEGVSWSTDNPSPFVQLLRDLEKIKRLETLSFLSPNPQDVSDDLIDWMSQSTVFSRTLNLPLQSGSESVLKRMNRRYSPSEYLKLVKKIKQAVPDIILSTDIIVGFPDETDEDFAKTVAIVKKVGFARAFIGIYSPREGSTSAKIYPDTVPKEVKQARWQVINELVNRQPTPLDARTAGRHLTVA